MKLARGGPKFAGGHMPLASFHRKLASGGPEFASGHMKLASGHMKLASGHMKSAGGGPEFASGGQSLRVADQQDLLRVARLHPGEQRADDLVLLREELALGQVSPARVDERALPFPELGADGQ